MKNLSRILLITGILLSMTACAVSNTTVTEEFSTGEVLPNQTENEEEATVVQDTSSVSAEEAIAGEVQVNEDPSDYQWDSADEINIMLADNAIQSESSDVTASGSIVTIGAPGSYRLSSSLSNGQVIVNTEEEGLVRLILDGVDIHNETGAAIFVENAEKVAVYLAANTENTLSDGTTYVLVDPESDEPNAALFSKADLTIDGDGSLRVTGNYNDAIASKDGLIINSGNLMISASDDGLRGKDYVLIRSATITIDVNGDGIKSDAAEDSSKGWIMIESGRLNIQAGMDGIDAETAVTIADGTLTVIAGDGTTATNFTSDVSMKGIKAGALIAINGGTFIIQSTDDGIHSNDSIMINGGEFTIETGDDGIHADTDLTIEKGAITIAGSYEGLESAAIKINGGQITITSSDDGINVAGGADGSGMNGGMGGPGGRNGGPGMDMFSGTGDYTLTIAGGTITMNAGGDGLDSNGSITMIGGAVVISGPTNDGNGAIDYMGSFSISGGTLVAAGSSGMAQSPDGNSTQPALLAYFGSTLSAGTPVSLVNTVGENVVTVIPEKDFSSIVISDPDMAIGEAYALMIGGTANAVDELGLSTSAANGGTEYSSFTLSNIVSQIGTGGMGDWGGRR